MKSINETAEAALAAAKATRANAAANWKHAANTAIALYALYVQADRKYKSAEAAHADYLTAKAAHPAARAVVATSFGAFAEADAAGDASANELYGAWHKAALALQTAHDGHHKAAANAVAAADAAEAKDQAAVAAADAALAANANYAADAPKADWEASRAASWAALDAALDAEDAQLAADAASELYRTAHADAAASAYALRTGRIYWVVQNQNP